MAVTQTPLKADALAPYIVTRALCIDGERVEVGTVIELTRVQAADMLSANKIVPYVAPPEPVAADNPTKGHKPAAVAKDAAEPSPADATPAQAEIG